MMWQLPQGKKGTILLSNARIIDPASGVDYKGELLVKDGVIADFAPGELGGANYDQKIDCQGHILAPGLVDIQVHFRDPGQLHKEDLNSGSKAAAAGGITSVVCQPNTSPVLDNVETLRDLQRRAKETSYINIYAYACISRQMKGEELTDMAKLVEAGAVGFTDDGLPIMNSQLMRQAMSYASNLGVPIVQHAEDLLLTNKGCINEGKVSFQLGVRGIPNVSEAAIVARDLLLLELTGGHYHVLHVSARESLELIARAKEKGLNVTCEVTPHHLFLTEEAVLKFGTNAKMNPPLRSEGDRQALLAGLKAGIIDAIATDHAPHELAGKNKPLEEANFGVVGVETMLPLALQLYHQGYMNLSDLLASMTYKPADILHLPAGRIAKNKPADLVLFDLNEEWVIKNEQLNSKSKNSPFDGQKVKGKPILTIVQGEIVYSTLS